jgi:hypothetical protein
MSTLQKPPWMSLPKRWRKSCPTRQTSTCPHHKKARIWFSRQRDHSLSPPPIYLLRTITDFNEEAIRSTKDWETLYTLTIHHPSSLPFLQIFQIHLIGVGSCDTWWDFLVPLLACLLVGSFAPRIVDPIWMEWWGAHRQCGNDLLQGEERVPKFPVTESS